MLPVSNAGHHNPLRCSITPQLVRDDDARLVTNCPSQSATEAHGSKAIPLWLHEHVEDHAILIDGAPEIMRDAVDLEEHLVQMPFVSGTCTPSPEASGIRRAELLAPPPDCFVTDHDPACRHQLFHVAK